MEAYSARAVCRELLTGVLAAPIEFETTLFHPGITLFPAAWPYATPKLKPGPQEPHEAPNGERHAPNGQRHWPQNRHPKTGTH